MDTSLEVRSAHQYNPARKEAISDAAIPGAQEVGDRLAAWSPEEDFDALTDRDFYPNDLSTTRERQFEQMRNMYPNMGLHLDPATEDDYRANQLIGYATVVAYCVLTFMCLSITLACLVYSVSTVLR